MTITVLKFYHHLNGSKDKNKFWLIRYHGPWSWVVIAARFRRRQVAGIRWNKISCVGSTQRLVWSTGGARVVLALTIHHIHRSEQSTLDALVFYKRLLTVATQIRSACIYRSEWKHIPVYHCLCPRRKSHNKSQHDPLPLDILHVILLFFIYTRCL